MTQRRRRRDRRAAFTLIELLVVISIIAILVSLTVATVIRALQKGPEAQTRSDLGDMDMQLSKMASQFHLKYLPSRLHLSKQNNYGNSQLDIDSKAFLQARFGRDCCYKFQSPPPQPINWNGDANPNEELYLEGEQVLVFLLGGVPVSNTTNSLLVMAGFSTNISNPATPPQMQAETRDGPYFQFQANRLTAITTPGSTGAFPVYIDGYKNNAVGPKPYLFFSGYGAEGSGNYDKYGSSDCASFGVLPYFSGAAATTQYLNPGTWQIISAGANGTFGPGGLWNPTTGLGPNLPGSDDQSNFSPRTLGAASN